MSISFQEIKTYETATNFWLTSPEYYMTKLLNLCFFRKYDKPRSSDSIFNPENEYKNALRNATGN